MSTVKTSPSNTELSLNGKRTDQRQKDMSNQIILASSFNVGLTLSEMTAKRPFLAIMGIHAEFSTYTRIFGSTEYDLSKRKTKQAAA